MKSRLLAVSLFLVGIWCLGHDAGSHRAKAQFNGCQAGFCSPVASGGGGGCTQATSFIARTSNPGGIQNTQWTNFICGGVTDGWWTKMDVVSLFAADISADGILNMVSTSWNWTINNAPTFTANKGFNNGGSPASSEQNNVETCLVCNYAQNSASFGACVVETGGTTSLYQQAAINQFSATGQNIYPKFSDGNTYIRVNDNPESAGIANSGNTTGLWSGVRSGATASQKYLGSTQIGTSTTPSTTPSTNDWFMGFVNGVGQSYNGLMMGAFIGGALTSTDVANFYSRLQTYNNAIAGLSC